MNPEIKFACARCQQHIEAPSEMAGTTAECPKCGKQLVVPSPLSASSNQTPPRSSSNIVISRNSLYIAVGILVVVFGIASITVGMLFFKNAVPKESATIQATDVTKPEIVVPKIRQIQQEHEAVLRRLQEKKEEELKAAEVEKENQKRQISLLGGDWGEQAGQFAQEIESKGIHNHGLVDYDKLEKIWNLYYRDTYCPKAELAKEYDQILPPGFPKKEAWEKQIEYEKRLSDAKEEAKKNWEKFKSESVIAIWNDPKANGWFKYGSTLVRESEFKYDSDCFEYDAESSMFSIFSQVECHSEKLVEYNRKITKYTKNLTIRLPNKPKTPLQQTKAKGLLKNKCRIGLRIRWLSLDSITAYDKAELTAQLIEFAVLDKENRVLLYWHESQAGSDTIQEKPISVAPPITLSPTSSVVSSSSSPKTDQKIQVFSCTKPARVKISVAGDWEQIQTADACIKLRNLNWDDDHFQDIVVQATLNTLDNKITLDQFYESMRTQLSSNNRFKFVRKEEIRTTEWQGIYSVWDYTPVTGSKKRVARITIVCGRLYCRVCCDTLIEEFDNLESVFKQAVLSLSFQ